MSRYQNVRYRKDKNPAKPAAQAPRDVPKPDEAYRERLRRLYEAVYKSAHGETVDAALRRTERLLQIHDREAEKVLAAEPKEGYRWTVSPAMYLRLQAQLEAQQKRQDALQDECWTIAREVLARELAKEGDSLCPPKETSATGAGKGTVPVSAARDSLNTNDQPGGNRDCPPAEGGPAAAPPIAA